MSADKVTEGLGQFKVARHHLMRAGRTCDEIHATTAHARTMLAVCAIDDAVEAFNEAVGQRQMIEDAWKVS